MKKLFTAVALIALMGAGCTALNPVAPTPAPAGETPVGKMSMGQFLTGSWKIKSMQRIGGAALDISSSDFTLSFDGEKMSGKVCNVMNGPYTVEDNLLTFGPIAQTKMFCEGLPGEVEADFNLGFKGNYTLAKQNEDLVMQGASVFVLERQGSTSMEDGAVDNSNVVGTWKMGAWKKPAQGEKLQDVSSLNLMLTLRADGKLSAKFCNSISGDYTLQAGKLSAPQAASTLMYCDGPVGEVESAFSADLAGMTANTDAESLIMTGVASQNTYMFAPVK